MQKGKSNRRPFHFGQSRLLPALIFSVVGMSCGGDGSSNRRPVPVSVKQIVNEDTPVTLGLTATDPEGDRITYRVATPPVHGTLALSETTGQALYTPAPDFAGTVTFSFTASDLYGPSAPAQVEIEFLPINDAPRFPEIPDLNNLPDAIVTRWTLGITDPDSTEINVDILNSDPQVARVNYNSELDTIELLAESYGETSITVRATDGLLTSERTFVFHANRVTREVEVAVSQPASSAIVIHNPLDSSVKFGLGWNDKSIFESLQDLVTAAVPKVQSDADVALDLWNFMTGHIYHNNSFAEERWEHDPLILVNSIGFGLCDDNASALAFMARELGLPARVWALDGHVVPEIQVNEKWAMYDADIKVYYRNGTGEIAGVEELASNPELITYPIGPLYPAPFYGYEQVIADIYASANNNRVEQWYESGAPSVSGTLELPPGASLHFPGTWVSSVVDYFGEQVPAYATVRVTVPPTTRQVLRMPLVLLAIRGEGTVRIAMQDYIIGSPALEELLQSNREFVPDVEILDAMTELELIMLLNPKHAGITELTIVRLTGLKVGGLVLGTEPLANDAAFANPSIPTFPF